MDYIELLKTHWLFLVINIVIFIGVVFMSWAAVRIGYGRDLRRMRAEFERAEETKLDEAAKALAEIGEQGRQLVALIVESKRLNLTTLLAQHYNLLTHLVGQQYVSGLDTYCERFLAVQSKLSAAARQRQQQQFGKFLQDGRLLYSALNAPILLGLLGAEGQPDQLASGVSVKRLMASLSTETR